MAVLTEISGMEETQKKVHRKRSPKWNRKQWVKLSGLSALLLLAFNFIFLGFFSLRYVNEFAHDVLFYLDGGWKIHNGLVPHHDFYLALGPLEYSLMSMGMSLCGGTVAAITITSILVSLFLGLWFYGVIHKHLDKSIVMILTTGLIIAVSTSTPFGHSPFMISPAMLYNRHGYALLTILFAECFLCLYQRQKNSFWMGFSTGASLIAQLFLKLNFFGIGALILLTTFSMHKTARKRLSGVLLGSLFAALLAGQLIHFHYLDFVNNMATAAHARTQHATIIQLIPSPINSILLLWSLSATGLLVIRSKAVDLWSKAKLVSMYLLIWVGSVLLLSTNSSESFFVLLPPWILLLVGVSLHDLPKGELTRRFAIGSIAGAVFLVLFSLTPVAVLAYRASTVKSSDYATLDGYHLDGLKFSTYKVDAKSNGKTYVDTLKAGLDLLNAHPERDRRTTVLGYNNPFSYLLHEHPSTGGSVWWEIDNNIALEQLPSPERFLGDANVVLVPKVILENRPTEETLQKTYLPYVKANFTQIDSNIDWDLYHRPVKK